MYDIPAFLSQALVHRGLGPFRPSIVPVLVHTHARLLVIDRRINARTSEPDIHHFERTRTTPN
ncbi:hypothetical protein ACFO3J_25255 [Streptomyces polygonati]|uniref:Uncharacterized protein n=1 Tax=Streptomyces polygonati TaxID=1617087 RepID=A0ABV8HRQ1_9ACTN